MSNTIPDYDGIYIPRAQYDALMAAAREFMAIFTEPDNTDPHCHCYECKGIRIAARMRAAGVDVGEKE